MADRGSVEGLGLAEAIEALRDNLLQARAAGATSEIQLPVESMTVELTVTATRSADGRAGFKVPFVPAEVGGGGSRERGTGQTVTVVFGGPVDREGRPVKVAQATSEFKGRQAHSRRTPLNRPNLHSEPGATVTTTAWLKREGGSDERPASGADPGLPH